MILNGSAGLNILLLRTPKNERQCVLADNIGFSSAPGPEELSTLAKARVARAVISLINLQA